MESKYQRPTKDGDSFLAKKSSPRETKRFLPPREGQDPVSSGKSGVNIQSWWVWYRQLLALLTHEDSTTNIELAKINRDIAASAKKDSSAMKTIAIMTMLFLPATFFAALFAMPSFDWEEPKIIQARFWIYWAFTIPTTALVFLVWIIMNNWKIIWAHCKNLRSNLS